MKLYNAWGNSKRKGETGLRFFNSAPQSGGAEFERSRILGGKEALKKGPVGDIMENVVSSSSRSHSFWFDPLIK